MSLLSPYPVGSWRNARRTGRVIMCWPVYRGLEWLPTYLWREGFE